MPDRARRGRGQRVMRRLSVLPLALSALLSASGGHAQSRGAAEVLLPELVSSTGQFRRFSFQPLPFALSRTVANGPVDDAYVYLGYLYRQPGGTVPFGTLTRQVKLSTGNITIRSEGGLNEDGSYFMHFAYEDGAYVQGPTERELTFSSVARNPAAPAARFNEHTVENWLNRDDCGDFPDLLAEEAQILTDFPGTTAAQLDLDWQARLPPEGGEPAVVGWRWRADGRLQVLWEFDYKLTSPLPDHVFYPLEGETNRAWSRLRVETVVEVRQNSAGRVSCAVVAPNATIPARPAQNLLRGHPAPLHFDGQTVSYGNGLRPGSGTIFAPKPRRGSKAILFPLEAEAFLPPKATAPRRRTP